MFVKRLCKQVPVLETSCSLGKTLLWNVPSPLFDAASFHLQLKDYHFLQRLYPGEFADIYGQRFVLFLEQLLIEDYKSVSSG